jgi:hypothetical protein
MTKAQDLTDKALQTFDDLQAQVDHIVDEIEANDFGDSSSLLLTKLYNIDKKLLDIYMDLEDTYSLVENLKLAP